ncbi:MAG: hypothetical protein RL637_1176 [Pseudomonadota bacterium]
MCGIVAGVAQRNVVPILLAGLQRLEYRGYDSAGLAVIQQQQLYRQREVGKVNQLRAVIEQQPMQGWIGIAHTRWATHGKPSRHNAHPHICNQQVCLVHNGIIENYQQLKAIQQAKGYQFSSETDTEVIVHEIHAQLQQHPDFFSAVCKTLEQLQGAYGLAILCTQFPDTLIACRQGSPLVIGIGIGEYFVASDIAALLPVTQRFIFLEEGDIAILTIDQLQIYDRSRQLVQRPIKESELKLQAIDKGAYRHYMLKEIYAQPEAIAETLQGRLVNQSIQDQIFGHQAPAIFDQIKAVQIIACGTSYHAGLIARYWFESLARIPCQVDVASEFRYRHPVLLDNTLIVTISQSGETADTLAALKQIKQLATIHSLTICNVAESSLVRESELVLLTRAGVEIGVASTKAFTTQLIGLLLLLLVLGRRFALSETMQRSIINELSTLPTIVQRVLSADQAIQKLAEQFAEKQHALFLGRGSHYPVAMEGALKLKEISYIHAEAYPAGELKHGPLALVDANMPVITVAPNNHLLEKLKANMQEVRARGGQLIVFMDETLVAEADENTQFIRIPSIHSELSPIIYTIPLQLLAYHVAVLKGTDVDQPRNLAKSVTVE